MLAELIPSELEALHASLKTSKPEATERAHAAALEQAAAESLAAGALEDALALVRMALVASPRSARAWSIAAQVYAAADELVRARVAAERACAHDEDDLASYVLAADLQLRCGDREAARSTAGYVLLHTLSDDLRARAARIVEAAT